jgi:hypothetical protein
MVRKKIDEYIPSRISRWIRDAVPKHTEELPFTSTEERINNLRQRYEASQFADFDQSIKLVQFAVEDVLPEDAKPPLYRSLHKLAIQLALDNRFFFDFPDFPDTSLTEYELAQMKNSLRELTFELDHEESLRRDFLEQLSTILTGFYKFYPNASGNLSAPLHGLIDTPTFVDALLHIIFLTLPKQSPYPFSYTYAQLQRNWDAAKQVHPVHSKLSSDEIIATYLYGTPFIEFLEQPVSIEITRDQWINHAILAAPSGHGKTQTLGSIISNFIYEKDPPAIFIIEPHDDLINKIQHLSVFNPENGRLRDRLVVIDPNDKPGFNFLDVGEADAATIEENFKYLMSALSSELTTKQSTAAIYILKLLQKIPDATIETLRQVMEENTKSLEKSAFASAIAQLDPYAQDFFKKQFYSTNMNDTRQQVAQRLYTVLGNDLFRTMFTSPKNTFSIHDAIQQKKIVLVNTSRDALKKDGSALFGRWMLTQITSAGFRRPKNSPLCLVVLDEAHQYFDENTETILSELRKFGIGLCAATQFLDQIPDRTKAAIYGNTAIKMSGPVSHKDANSLAHEMYCTGDFIRSCRSYHRSHTEFALHTKSLRTAVKVTIPFGVLENAPQMTHQQYQTFRKQNKARYGTREAPIKEASNEASRPHPTSVTTAPPPTQKPITDPHAGIDD